MDAPLRELLPTLVAFAGLCLAMAVVMVRFSAAMIAPRPPAEPVAPAPPRDSRAALLGLAYLLLWAGIIAVLVRLLARLGEPLTPRRVLLLVLVAGAWLGFNALWIVGVRKLLRADAIAAAAAAAGEPATGEEEEEEEEEEEDPAGRLAAARTAEEIRVAGRPDPATLERPSPAPRPWWRRALSTLLLVLAVLALLVLGEALPPLQELEGYLAERRTVFAVAAGAVAALGFVLLMAGTVLVALAQGRPLSRREIDEMRQRGMAAGPAAGLAGAYRGGGDAAGVGGGEEVSFRDIKVAFHARAWTFSRRWRRIFTAAAGAALFSLGLCALGFVLGPPGVKLLVAAAVLYAVIQIARGIARA